MTWPTPQDYAEAIQNPAVSFRDPELRRSKPELTPLGLPRPITGNFASVYKMAHDNSAIAVRCFFREFADMRERYAAISSTLESRRLPYTVGFSYLADGITVRKTTYPLLKMDWVEGLLLDEYIKSHLNDARALRDLAGAWQRMAASLQSSGVAHGDLQHGNVLCLNGEIRLVDYDGMFVPGLHHRQSQELGHPNYQHPGRTAAHFGSYLDHFSQWVIYASIVAVSVEPELWTDLAAGDERLLFGRDDFARPDASPTFKRLSSHADMSVRSAVERVRRALEMEVPAVPALDGGVVPLSRRKRSVIRRREPAPGSSQAALPDWMAGQVQTATPLEFAESGPLPRVTLGVITSLFAIDLLPTTARLLSNSVRADVALGLTASSCLLVSACYLTDSNVRVRLRLQTRRILWLIRLRSSSARLTAAERRGSAIEVELAQARRSVDRDRAHLDATHGKRLGEVQTSVKQLVGALSTLVREYQQRRDQALSEALDVYRRRLIERELRLHRLWSSSLRCIGWRTKITLWCRGIRTAADVNSAHASLLNRLSGPEAAALLEWREGCCPATPVKLPVESAARVTNRLDHAITGLEKMRRDSLLSAAPVLTSLKEWRSADESKLRLAVEAADDWATRRRSELRDQTDQAAAAVLDANRRLDLVEDALESFRRLTVVRYVGRLLFGRRALRVHAGG